MHWNWSYFFWSKSNNFLISWLKRVFHYPSFYTNPPSAVTNKKSFISIPCKNLSEKISKLFQIYNINCFFRPQLPLKNLLCKAKLSLSPFDALSIICKISFKDCESSFLGETGRTCNGCLKENTEKFIEKVFLGLNL